MVTLMVLVVITTSLKVRRICRVSYTIRPRHFRVAGFRHSDSVFVILNVVKDPFLTRHPERSEGSFLNSSS